MSSISVDRESSSDLLEIVIGPAVTQVSPDLWGIFFEDLNDALDGGLNAELVANGDFEYSTADAPKWGPLTAWGVVTPSGTRTVWPRTENPIHPNNATYLHVVGPTTLRNEGWDGVGVAAGDRFRLRIALRSAAGSSVDIFAKVCLAGQDLAVAPAVSTVTIGEWAWFETELVAVAEGRGRLEISVPAGAAVDLDAISLRRLDSNGQPELFRADLLEALRALRPSFVRFPGGCLAHGIGLDNVYDWKGSIGERHTRRQLPNLWGYHQSRAVGYLEYFQLCEELGATPIPVIAAGVCCQNTPGGPRAVPLAEMPAYVRDVLDLIEFATGGVETPWGARRAELGHPRPFDLRYLGIGNEDEITDDFRERYALIEDAVRAVHPDLTVIGTSGTSSFGRDYEAGWDFARGRGTRMVDEHYYESPLWFHQNPGRYDNFDRTGPAVYLGEYAARSNRVRSALAEAVHMVGIERNSDVVRLASYAPLLARIGHTQWQPDLIYFDAERVLPSASYYVQQMFSAERGELVHLVSATLPEPIAVQPQTRGPIAIRLARGQFGMRDILVNGQSLDDFTLDVGRTELPPTELDVLDLSFLAERQQDDSGLSIEFGVDGPEPTFGVEISSWQNERTTVRRRQHGIDGDVAEAGWWQGFTNGTAVAVRIVIDGSRLRLWLDGALVHDVHASDAPEHRVAVSALSRSLYDGRHQQIVRLVNARDTGARALIQREHGRLSGGSVTVLAGAGPDDGRPDEASPITPAAHPFSLRDGVLDVDLPPWSLVVVIADVEVEEP